MEANQIAKQMIEFQKMSFDNLYSSIALVQDQAVSTMDIMLNQNPWIPEDGRSAIQNWTGILQDERNRFKDYVHKSFVSLEKVFAEAGKQTEKAKKAAS